MQKLNHTVSEKLRVLSEDTSASSGPDKFGQMFMKKPEVPLSCEEATISLSLRRDFL